MTAAAALRAFHTASLRPYAATPAAPRVAPATLHLIRLPLHTASLRHFAADAKDGKQQQQQQQSSGHSQQQSESSGEESKSPDEEEGNAVLGLAIIALGTAGVAYLLLREKPPEGVVEEPFYDRWWDAARGMVMGDTPLLPPETLDATGRRPRTVVLNFDKTLVHCGWSRAGGWEVRKRPGVDQLIERLHLAGYELVLWANMPMFEVEPTLAELDPLGYFKHKLYNESTNYKYVDPHSWWPSLVKDLARLQRDPKRLIVIDTDKSKYSQIGDKENVMIISPFVDDINDKQLMKVLRILEGVKRYNVHDVSDLIHRFNANPDADLFVKEREQEARAMAKLKGDSQSQRNRAGDKQARKAIKKGGDEEEDEEEEAKKPKQAWGRWLKSWTGAKQ